MIRMLGAVLVAAGCVWLGEKKTRRLKDRVRMLSSLSLALEQMERELQLRLLPLPVLMEELSVRGDPLVRDLFRRAREALETLPETTFDQAWANLTKYIPNLDESDRRLLLPLGQILGRYDGPGQAASLALVRKELERHQEQARGESIRLGRVYRAVGAAGGGFLIILLL